jgi:ubiquinone/menaquinone biosynthesis C-methylase UbiE
VTCITILAFVPDVSNAVREMARVPRAGGQLVIGDLGKCISWAARRRICGWFGATLCRAARFWTAKELAAMVKERISRQVRSVARFSSHPGLRSRV